MGAFASRLPNGNTLISDQNNSRVIEVSPDGNVVRGYVTNLQPGSVAMPQPTRAVRLKDGNTLISNQFDDQVIEVDPSGNIVFSLRSLEPASTSSTRHTTPKSWATIRG